MGGRVFTNNIQKSIWEKETRIQSKANELFVFAKTWLFEDIGSRKIHFWKLPLFLMHKDNVGCLSQREQE